MELQPYYRTRRVFVPTGRRLLPGHFRGAAECPLVAELGRGVRRDRGPNELPERLGATCPRPSLANVGRRRLLDPMLKLPPPRAPPSARGAEGCARHRGFAVASAGVRIARRYLWSCGPCSVARRTWANKARENRCVPRHLRHRVALKNTPSVPSLPMCRPPSSAAGVPRSSISPSTVAHRSGHPLDKFTGNGLHKGARNGCTLPRNHHVEEVWLVLRSHCSSMVES